MKTKHTLGPWKVENHIQHSGPFTAARLEIWSPNRHIGTIHEHVDDLSEDECNAALIAAAPEMLAALKAASQLLGEISSKNGMSFFSVGGMIDDAIAKAEGRS